MAIKFAKKLDSVPESKPLGTPITKPVAAKKLPGKKLKNSDQVISIPAGMIKTALDIKVTIDGYKEIIVSHSLELDKAMTDVMSYAEGYPAEQKLILDDGSCLLKLGEMGKSTEVTASIKEVHAMLGDDVFYAVAKVGITDLKAYLTPAELEKITKVVQEGARSKKFILKNE